MFTKLNIEYEIGFEMHGDSYPTWEGSYQNGCRRKNHNFKRRTQSEELHTATAALRKMSYWMGLGSKKPPAQLTTTERQLDFIIRGMGFGAQASQILMGMSATLPQGNTMPAVMKEESVKPESVERVKPERD